MSRLVIPINITAISPVTRHRYMGGAGESARFEQIDDGWQVFFATNGSKYSMVLEEKPDLVVGPAKITLENTP